MPLPLQRIEIVIDRVATDVGTLYRGGTPYLEADEAQRLVDMGAARFFEYEERTLTPAERAQELGAPEVDLVAKRNARVDRMARGAATR